MSDKVEYRMDPGHALSAFWVTWEALGVAIQEVALLTGSEAHIQHLRAKMLAPFLGTVTETEEGAGVTHPGLTSYLRNFEPEALEAGIQAVDAAIARTVFSHRPGGSQP
jgi:hypothetical protein